MRGIRVDYESVEDVERALRRHADAVQDSLWQIRHQVANLQSGGWLGEAADAFYDEVESVLYTHLNTLNEDLADTSKGVKITLKLFDDSDVGIRPYFGAGGGAWQGYGTPPSYPTTKGGGGSNEVTMDDSAGAQNSGSGAGGGGAAGNGAGPLGGFAGLNPQGLGGGAGLTIGGATGGSSGSGSTGGSTSNGGGGAGFGGGSRQLNTGFRSSFGQIDGVLRAHGIVLPTMVSAIMQTIMVEPGIAPAAVPAGDSAEAKLAANPRFQAVLHAIYNNPNDPDGYMELALILDQAGFREQAIQSYQAFINLSNPESWSYTDITTAQARITALAS